ncbi:hypothetical protein GCM10009111_03230 [Colwellia asteriadis]|uniref:DUF892 family protein n=1 Tax=Colwellia asteriadis TaxID=517723 RepID=A0ABP3WBV1_9GAMM
MFTYLSDLKQVTQLLTSFSAKELKIATDNINALDKRLSTPVIELLENRKKHGKLFIDQAVAAEGIAIEKATLSLLLLNNNALAHHVNRLCLSEAVIVRDTLLNGLDMLAIAMNEHAIKKQAVKTLRSRLLSHEKNEPIKDLSQTATANNVMPIQLLEVKQRLANALTDETSKNSAIKNKLNSQLSARTHTSNIDNKTLIAATR